MKKPIEFSLKEMMTQVAMSMEFKYEQYDVGMTSELIVPFNNMIVDLRRAIKKDTP